MNKKEWIESTFFNCFERLMYNNIDIKCEYNGKEEYYQAVRLTNKYDDARYGFNKQSVINGKWYYRDVGGN